MKRRKKPDDEPTQPRVYKRREFQGLVATLSERERTIMIAIANGESPSLTARRLRINVRTVNTFRHRVQEKLALRSNVDIAVSAYKAGMRP